MRPGHYIRQLLEVNEAYRLEDRLPQDMPQIIFMAEQGLLDDVQARAILIQLDPVLEELRRRPILLPCAAEPAAIGTFDIRLGELTERPGVPIGVRLRDRVRHVLISGGTGAGKSIVQRSLFRGVHDLNTQSAEHISVIAIDIKGDLAHLASELGEPWDHYSFHDGLRIGLNAPGDALPPNVWITQVSRILASRCHLVMSRSCLASMMGAALPAMNSSGQTPLAYPSVPLLHEIARTTPLEVFASKPDYGRTLLQALDGLIGESEGLFDCFRGLDVVEHVIKPRRCAVIDVTTVSPLVIRLIVDILLLQVLCYRLFLRQTTDRTEVLFALDEADVLSSGEATEAFTDYSPLEQTLKMGRELGIMVCLAVAHLCKASQFIRSNVHYHVLMNQLDHESAWEAARTMQMPRGGERLFTMLEPGECIYREGQGPASVPMLAQMDFLPPSRAPRPTRFDRHPFMPAKHLDELPELPAALRKRTEEHRATANRQARSRLSELGKAARDLMDLACLKPFIPVARLWDELGKPSFAVQKKIRRKLKAQKLAQFEELRVGRRMLLLIGLTEKAYRLLGKPAPKHSGRGSISHVSMVHWIRIYLERQGIKAQTEWIVPGTNHPADLAYHKAGRRHVFEVVSQSVDNLVGHIEAALIRSPAVEDLTIVASEKKTLERIRATVDREASLSAVRDRVHYRPAAYYLKELGL